MHHLSLYDVPISQEIINILLNFLSFLFFLLSFDLFFCLCELINEVWCVLLFSSHQYPHKLFFLPIIEAWQCVIALKHDLFVSLIWIKIDHQKLLQSEILCIKLKAMIQKPVLLPYQICHLCIFHCMYWINAKSFSCVRFSRSTSLFLISRISLQIGLH